MGKWLRHGQYFFNEIIMQNSTWNTYIIITFCTVSWILYFHQFCCFLEQKSLVRRTEQHKLLIEPGHWMLRVHFWVYLDINIDILRLCDQVQGQIGMNNWANFPNFDSTQEDSCHPSYPGLLQPSYPTNLNPDSSVWTQRQKGWGYAWRIRRVLVCAHRTLHEWRDVPSFWW